MTGDPEITDPRDPYRRPDIVTELDRWLARWRGDGLMQRARDEIVALRKLTDGNWVWQQITSSRDDALEEAAGVCDEMARSNAAYTWPAAAIRALKDKKHNE